MGRWQGKYVIGLTGNIAMGKSLVRQMLQHLGAYTLDADGLAHQVMAPNAPAYKPVVETFGRWIVNEQGQIDRDKLGAVAFSHPVALALLEKITHPVVSSAVDTLITRAKHKVIVVEAIKLLETELGGFVDAIWVVDATPEAQQQRLMTKRGLSQVDAVKRINVQNPQADKLAKAGVVIKNNGKPEETWAQVQSAWQAIAAGKEDSAAAEQVKTVQIAPAAPAQPAQPAAAPAQAGQPAAPAAPAAPAPSGDGLAITSLAIKRPRPSDFPKIVTVINETTGRSITTDDIMEAFGEKTYLMAEANNMAVGVIAFNVENLVTRVDEFVVHAKAPLPPVGGALIESMEEASNDLQSEVAFVFLPQAATDQQSLFASQGYEKVAVEDIKIPAWREAVSESKPPDTVVLTKRLREKLVLKPI